MNQCLDTRKYNTITEYDVARKKEIYHIKNEVILHHLVYYLVLFQKIRNFHRRSIS